MKASAIFVSFALALMTGGIWFPIAALAQQSAGEPAYVEASKLEAKGDFDGARAKVTESLQLDPNNLKARVLLGDLDAKKQMWPEAEQDFQAALKIDPANAFAKFDLAELQLMQKRYADARPGFNELTGDPQLGDFAAYKVFLCDLFAGNREAAGHELEAFDQAQDKPSYYYANAASKLFDKKPDDAQSWLNTAANKYPPQVNHNYLSTLSELGYLPEPAK